MKAAIVNMTPRGTVKKEITKAGVAKPTSQLKLTPPSEQPYAGPPEPPREQPGMSCEKAATRRKRAGKKAVIARPARTTIRDMAMANETVH
jgi:hypothetical protein